MITRTHNAIIEYTWKFANDDQMEIPLPVLDILIDTAENVFAENIKFGTKLETSLTEFLLIDERDDELTKFEGLLTVTFPNK